MPMKLGIEPQTAAETGTSVRLASTYRSTATGSPLRSASQGMRGLNASRRTSTGTSSSDR